MEVSDANKRKSFSFGEAVSMEVTTVTGVVRTNSHLYTISILDRENCPHEIKAFGMDQLNGRVQRIEVGGVKHLFSTSIQQDWDKVAVRPVGEVELLIGSDNLGLHPTELEAHGNLKVYKSRFASGYVIVGKHPALRCVSASNEVNAMSMHVSLRANKLSFKSIRQYFDANELNVETPRR